MSGIDIGKLASEIQKSLSIYSDNIVNGIDLTSDLVAKEAVRTLKATSPKGRRKGRYARSWTAKTFDGSWGSPKTRVIHVKAPEYRLTHLLEHGHILRDGGRAERRPHIRAAEKEVIRNFENKVKEMIKSES